MSRMDRRSNHNYGKFSLLKNYTTATIKSDIHLLKPFTLISNMPLFFSYLQCILFMYFIQYANNKFNMNKNDNIHKNEVQEIR